MEKLAAAYRAQFDIPVVGITGSVGKTTAKEMISAVLEQRYRTLKTEGNLNNRYGIPMMLSRLDESCQAAVIEMGISEFGEMHHLAHMVQPTVAVYTVIGHAHLEFLQDLDGVLRAKTEMLDDIPETAPVLVNGESASASEITCGALQDLKRAKIIGTRTYGKGLVQVPNIDLPYNANLKLTTSRYYLPSGRMKRLPPELPIFEMSGAGGNWYGRTG